jgi:hypothetical protein
MNWWSSSSTVRYGQTEFYEKRYFPSSQSIFVTTNSCNCVYTYTGCTVKWAKMPHWPMIPHHHLLRNLSLRKLHKLCSQKVFQWRVWVCESHSCCVVLYALTLFSKVSNMVFNLLYFREPFFNNFLFLYAYSNFTNSLREGRVDFSLPLYRVTNFRKPRHSYVISQGIFAPRLGTVSPLKDG